MSNTVKIKALVRNICHPEEDRMIEIGEVVDVPSTLADVLTRKQAEIMNNKPASKAKTNAPADGGTMVTQTKTKDGKPSTNAKQSQGDVDVPNDFG